MRHEIRRIGRISTLQTVLFRIDSRRIFHGSILVFRWDIYGNRILGAAALSSISDDTTDLIDERGQW